MTTRFSSDICPPKSNVWGSSGSPTIADDNRITHPTWLPGSRVFQTRIFGHSGLTEAQSPTGSLNTALGHAARLLPSRPALAEAQAREILAVVPGNAPALLILAEARTAQ